MDKRGIEIVFAFDTLVRNYPDRIEFVNLFSSFMVSAFRFKDGKSSLPFGEMMMILRSEKPKVINLMESQNHMILDILLNMKMDPIKAKDKVNNIINHNYSNFML